MICAKCGALMDQTDKNTFTGHVIREYACRKCGHTDWEDDGIALWQVLEDLQEKHEAKVAAHSATNEEASQPEAPQPAQKPPASLWQRFAGLFRERK